METPQLTPQQFEPQLPLPQDAPAPSPVAAPSPAPDVASGADGWPRFTPEQWKKLPRQEKEFWRKKRQERVREERRAARLAGRAESRRLAAVPARAAGPLSNHGKAASPFLPPSAACPAFPFQHNNGSHIFLLLSGPSVRELDLTRLAGRGVVSMGVNNSPTMFRTDYWIYVDRPYKFHDAIWLDPGICKIAPRQHARKWPLHYKHEGEFRRLLWPNGEPMYPIDMPNVLWHERNAFFRPDDWLDEGTINWGNSKKSAAKNGFPRILNVMLAALKACYSLGFRVVYLLGADFSMDHARPYAFDQGKCSGGVAGNNHSYATLRQMFSILKPRFDDAGFFVFNCNPRSELDTFPHCTYDEALRCATEPYFDSKNNPIDTKGWYDQP